MCGGAVFLYFAADFKNTNLDGYYAPGLIQGGLFIIGVTLIAIGAVKMIIGYFSETKKSSLT